MTENASASKTVVAMFEYEDEANRAAEDLVREGFPRENIHIVAGEGLAHPQDHVTCTEDSEGKVMDAIGKGLGIGGGLGAIVGGISSLLIPAFGPLVLGGALASAFLGAGLGASVGGVMAGLMKAGVDESDARLFEAALRHGGVVLAVQTDEEHARKAVRLLDRQGALDMDEHRQVAGDRGEDTVKGSVVSRVDDTHRDHSTEPER